MALDQNDLAALKTLFAEQTTAAVKAAVDPLSAELAALKTAQASAPKALTLEDVQTVLGDKLKDVPTREDLAAEIAKVAAANAAKGEPAGQGQGQGADAGKPVDVTSDPKFVALQEQFEAMQRKATVEREQAAQEARRRLLRDTIAKHGFRGREEHAARYLEAERAPDGEPLLRTDKDGKLCWAKEHLGSVRLFPLDDGVKGWAETDEGKSYLPPKGAEGTGDHAGAAGGSGQKVISLKDLGKAIGGKLLQNNG